MKTSNIRLQILFLLIFLLFSTGALPMGPGDNVELIMYASVYTAGGLLFDLISAYAVCEKKKENESLGTYGTTYLGGVVGLVTGIGISFALYPIDDDYTKAGGLLIIPVSIVVGNLFGYKISHKRNLKMKNIKEGKISLFVLPNRDGGKLICTYSFN
jgi:hypothetical protein